MINDPKYGHRPFPSHFTEFRDSQEDIIEECNEHFSSGKKIVLLNAPTGSGKSLIGEALGRLQGPFRAYCCTTKALQEQFVHDFSYGRVVMGRANYLTASGPLNTWGKPTNITDNVVTCSDCTYNRDDGCKWCVSQLSCPYIQARNLAQDSELAILNTAYFLTDANKGGGRFTGGVGPRRFVVIDEADKLEDELLNQVEINVTPRRMNRIGIDPPERKTVELDRDKYVRGPRKESWHDWLVREGLPKVEKYYQTLPGPGESDVGVEELREYKSTQELWSRLQLLERELPQGGWVYDGYEEGSLIFRPVHVNQWGERYLWPHGEKFLLMSATILSADLMAEHLGMQPEQIAFVDMPSTFPKEHRPIFVVPIADMSFKVRDEEWPKMVEGVQAVLDKHPNERVLVHTVSYKLARYLCDHLVVDRPLHTYTNSKDKTRALGKYKSQRNSVLIASSMDRGVDLPDDYCRVQVVTKIPFMDLKDKRVNARMIGFGGTQWYRMQAIRSLVQMTGRGVRHKEDKCVTYILDKQFVSNIWKGRDILPSWWKEALRMDLGPKKFLEGNYNVY